MLRLESVPNYDGHGRAVSEEELEGMSHIRTRFLAMEQSQFEYFQGKAPALVAAHFYTEVQVAS